MLVTFEQNRMVQTTRNFEVFDKKAKTKTKTKTKNKQNKTKKQVFKNHFNQRAGAILEDFSVAETII